MSSVDLPYEYHDDCTDGVVHDALATCCWRCGWELGKKQAKTSDKQTPEAKGAKNKETFDQIGGGMEAEDQVEVGASVKAVVTGVLPTFLAVRLGPWTPNRGDPEHWTVGP